MKTPHFKLPTTKMTVVVWFRSGQRNETLIQTPVSCADLGNIMLMKYRVGVSEIRALKSVDARELLGQRF